MTAPTSSEHLDVVIVGAGLSGIGAGSQLEMKCPGRTYAVLEARNEIGGTWDLFRYPGIRSDSDMFTLGYAFRPWTDPKAIADGPSILRYVRDTAREGGIEPHVRFGHKVVSAAWSSPEANWTVAAKRADTGETVTLTCDFLFVNSGYYSYEGGYTPEFPGRERFAGEVVHPQHWPEGLDYSGKRVVVIGSGATAMSMRPHGVGSGDANGSTAHVSIAGMNASAGAMRNSHFSTSPGLLSSLKKFLIPSATGCRMPPGPARFGPRRS